jgi:hypothetical protein
LQCGDTAYQRTDRGSTMPQRLWMSYPCRNRAKFRVVLHPGVPRIGYPEFVCGVHEKGYRGMVNVKITERL